MDLTLPLVAVVAYVAYSYSEKESRKRRELRNTKSSTVGENIYQSDDVRKNAQYVQALADTRYAASKNTKETRIVPNFFNTSCQIIDCSLPDNPLKERKKLSDFPTQEKKENFSMLAGGQVDVSKHNNMQPFYRGSSTGTRKADNADIVGIYTGSQKTYKAKEESTPFFQNVKQEINKTDNYIKDASRYIGSLYKNGEKPIEEQRVRRILEDDLRPVYKNLDQLRIDPKQSYKAVFKKGQMGSERGLLGEVVKNRPETLIELSPSRYNIDAIVTRPMSKHNFRQADKDDLSENPQQLSQVFSANKLKYKNRVSKDSSDGFSTVLEKDSRNTDKTFGISGAISSVKKTVNNTTNGMREACRVEIESYISSAGTSNLVRVRPENLITDDRKETYSNLGDYAFKQPVGAVKIPESSKIKQKLKNDDNKIGDLRISRIVTNTPGQEDRGDIRRKTREKPENSRFFQDVENLPHNELIKKFS